MNSATRASAKETFGGAGSLLFMNEQKSDVSIVVESDTLEYRFPAHSLILTSMSDVMSTMLTSDMMEKSTNKIVMEDTSPFAIKHFLKFVYTGEMPISEWHEVIEILRIAHKYQVQPLVRICEMELYRSLTLNRACAMYEMAQMYSLQTLMTEAQSLILHSAFAVISTYGFEELSSKSLEFFLSNRLLNIENELTLLDAVKTWAKAECIRRKILITKQNVLTIMKPFLKFIRFRAIPAKQRKFIPLEYTEDTNPVNSLSRVKFFVSPLIHEHMTSVKFVVDLGNFVTKPMSEPLTCVKISSDRNLFILGFRIVGLFRSGSPYDATSCTIMFSKETKCCRNNTSIVFNLKSVPWKSGALVGNNVWREVVAYLPNPARLEKFSCYKLCLEYGNVHPTKWPRTRLESNTLTTELASVNIYTFGQTSALTELFTLPASSTVLDCNGL